MVECFDCGGWFSGESSGGLGLFEIFCSCFWVSCCLPSSNLESVLCMIWISSIRESRLAISSVKCFMMALLCLMISLVRENSACCVT